MPHFTSPVCEHVTGRTVAWDNGREHAWTQVLAALRPVGACCECTLAASMTASAARHVVGVLGGSHPTTQYGLSTTRTPCQRHRRAA
eukprot:4215213-Prymnesium_polylepis.1